MFGKTRKSKAPGGKRAPSPAMIVAAIAVILAMAGTAIAGPDALSKITNAKVKSIATKQINKAAPNLNVNSAKTADTAKVADTAKIAGNIFSANVKADGSLLGSVPGGATSSKTATGTYNVSFGRPVAGCTISASAGSSAGINFGIVSAGVQDPNTILVFTRTGPMSFRTSRFTRR